MDVAQFVAQIGTAQSDTFMFKLSRSHLQDIQRTPPLT
jgi:hypothetical protein